MSIFFDFMYYMGFESVKHHDVLALVVLSWSFENGQHVDVPVLVVLVLDSRMVNM